MFSKYHTSFINREDFPGTYFTILPIDLLKIINAYYAGPIEIQVDIDPNSSHKPGTTIDLDIYIFDSSVEVQTLFRLWDFSIVDLWKYYVLNPDSGHSGTTVVTVSWHIGEIELYCKYTSIWIRDDHRIKLFWSKIKSIIDKINQYKQSNLSDQQINALLTATWF